MKPAKAEGDAWRNGLWGGGLGLGGGRGGLRSFWFIGVSLSPGAFAYKRPKGARGADENI